MRIVLALLAAMASSVLGVAIGRYQRPLSPRRLLMVIIVAVIASGVAETGTVLLAGAPVWVVQPMVSGFVLGWLAAFFSGRRRPPKQDDEAPPS